jgi:hypothetical protein
VATPRHHGALSIQQKYNGIAVRIFAEGVGVVISDEHLKQLGRVTVNFQTVELFLVFVLSEVIGTEQVVGQMIASQLPFGRLCTLATALVAHRAGENDPLTKEFASVAEECLRLEQLRNQLMHSVYLVDGQTAEVTRWKSTLKLSKGFRTSTESLAPTDIGKVADGLKVVSERLGKCIGSLADRGLAKNVSDGPPPGALAPDK